ncbi:FliI/YscN family ATPase [Falsiroseomonas sp.]|uniref:FliI/YscN family ATPase n=1 Tax=Falsiroseomonas sp. TaxID=2870721 RepID=UPI002734DF40|nr:FliI/YscN family ATPase [Falsiroseomonas sp.]MDP3415173.1 FliI/YscN family ATPase [Falsiroseomonas sp.]
MKIHPWSLAGEILRVSPRRLRRGQVRGADLLTVDIAGFRPQLAIGERLSIQGAANEGTLAEVVSVGPTAARAVVFGETAAIAEGLPVEVQSAAGLHVGEGWRGRVVDPLGNPMDGKGPLRSGQRARPTRAAAPSAALRQRLGPPVSVGVRVIDAFCTMREGQRLGLFAASGIGKSTLLATMARATSFDTIVLALIGERGRELREFIEDDLGPEGMARSVVVCATSDASAALRREAGYASLAVAEYFRDAGQRVLLLLDSVTRFALACREIGLAAGEPPATRGYPPSVFRELPALLERAGPGGPGAGSITALLTVLVEGDDHDEPVADAVRGILDGHVVLDRRIAEAGRFPAVEVLRSLSRSVPGCQTADQAGLVRRARRLLALRDDVADLVRLGAYRNGTDPETDAALRLAPRIEAVLHQARGEVSTLEQAFHGLAEALADAPA